MPTPNNPLRDKADVFLAMIKEHKKIDLDYSLFSLLYIDTVLEEMFGKRMERISDPKLENFRLEVTKQLGCFFGECIRETFSGEWKNDPKTGLSLTRIGNQEVTAFPMATASDRMAGEEGKIFAVTMAITREVFKQVGEKVYP